MLKALLGALYGFLFPEPLRGRADLLAAQDPQKFRTLQQNLDPIAQDIINASLTKGRIDSRLLLQRYGAEVVNRRLSLDEAAVLWECVQRRIGNPVTGHRVTGHWLLNLQTYMTFDDLLKILQHWPDLLGGITPPATPEEVATAERFQQWLQEQRLRDT